MCNASFGPQQACPGVPTNVPLDACMAAGCCFDEFAVSPALQCFQCAGVVEVAIALPAATPANACFTSMDFAGFMRNELCAVGGLLSMNLTDGPTYLL